MDFRGNRGGTQGKPYDNERGRPLSMLRKWQLVDIRERNSIGSARESELPILYRLYLKDSITLGEGRGNAFIMFLKEIRKGDCGYAINSKYSEISGGSYTGRPSASECLWKKMIGKPCAGKPPARFDEGELEIEPPGHYASSLLYCRSKIITLVTEK
jgi:hypothetical protein